MHTLEVFGMKPFSNEFTTHPSSLYGEDKLIYCALRAYKEF